MFYTGTPEFAFGAGMSYTTWAMKWAHDGSTTSTSEPLVYSLSTLTASEENTLRVRVHNVGTRAGRHTALMFWRPKASTGTTNKVKLVRKLVGYAGTGELVYPGQNTTLDFSFGLSEATCARRCARHHLNVLLAYSCVERVVHVCIDCSS